MVADGFAETQIQILPMARLGSGQSPRLRWRGGLKRGKEATQDLLLHLAGLVSA
jgi:hypothetical protein